MRGAVSGGPGAASKQGSVVKEKGQHYSVLALRRPPAAQTFILTGIE